MSKLTDSVQAHDIPVVISVSVEPPQNGYGPSNKITSYKSVKAASEVKQAPVAAAASGSGEAKPSWM